MPVTIRLVRLTRTRDPLFNIVVTQTRTGNYTRPMEVLGSYDPMPRRDPYEMVTRKPTDPLPKPHKNIQLDMTRAKYWVGVGATPTDAARRILAMVGIMEPKKRPQPLPPLGPLPEHMPPAQQKKE